ncbi:MAG: heme exporter protein CcmD [Porticoccaceae bacterium]|nr:heme exporter protein CcmD [Porticoccaceae bacterium]
MNFQFENLQQLLAMEGHGPFVWTAVVVSLAVMIRLVTKPMADSKAAQKDVARDIARATNSNGEA